MTFESVSHFLIVCALVGGLAYSFGYIDGRSAAIQERIEIQKAENAAKVAALECDTFDCWE